jgi:hypothetical protein
MGLVQTILYRVGMGFGRMLKNFCHFIVIPVKNQTAQPFLLPSGEKVATQLANSPDEGRPFRR